MHFSLSRSPYFCRPLSLNKLLGRSPRNRLFFSCYRLQISWELNGCAVIWPQTTTCTSSHSRTLIPCTSMPLLTSSDRGWCCLTRIVRVTRYRQTGEGTFPHSAPRCPLVDPYCNLLVISRRLFYNFLQLFALCPFFPHIRLTCSRRPAGLLWSPHHLWFLMVGTETLTYTYTLLLHNTGVTIKGHCACLCRPPAVDVLQVAVHERPDAGWETCDGWRQWEHHSQNVWKSWWVHPNSPLFGERPEQFTGHHCAYFLSPNYPPALPLCHSRCYRDKKRNKNMKEPKKTTIENDLFIHSLQVSRP